jgi:hypothetical protein
MRHQRAGRGSRGAVGVSGSSRVERGLEGLNPAGSRGARDAPSRSMRAACSVASCSVGGFERNRSNSGHGPPERVTEVSNALVLIVFERKDANRSKNHGRKRHSEPLIFSRVRHYLLIGQWWERVCGTIHSPLQGKHYHEAWEPSQGEDGF